MTAQQLRNSILQQAIQGRLVPQDPNDEPASVVIDKSLYKGKISILQEEEYPFEIPSNWCFCRLQDVAITIGGYAFKSEELKGNIGTRVIRISDVTPSGFSNKNIVRYNKNLLLEQYEVHKDDILIAMTGGTVGKSLYVDNLSERLLLNQRVAIVRAENIYPLYLDLVIKSPLTQDIVSERKNSTNDNISMVDIKGFIIPLPPLAEQRRIVAKIEELMPLVEKYGKAQSELDNLNASLPSRLRQSVLQQAIQGKLVPHDSTEGTGHDLLDKIRQQKEQLVKDGKLKKKDLVITPIADDEKPFDIPENWCWVKFGDVLRKMKTRRPSGENFLYVDIDAIDNKRCVIKSPKLIPTTQAPSRASRYTQKGDVLFSMVRPYLRNIAIVDGDDYIASTGFYVCSPIMVDSHYMYQFLTSNYLVSGVNQFMRGDNSPSINANHLEEFLFPLPPLAEQRRIVAKIEELFAEIEKLK